MRVYKPRPKSRRTSQAVVPILMSCENTGRIKLNLRNLFQLLLF